MKNNGERKQKTRRENEKKLHLHGRFFASHASSSMQSMTNEMG